MIVSPGPDICGYRGRGLIETLEPVFFDVVK